MADLLARVQGDGLVVEAFTHYLRVSRSLVESRQGQSLAESRQEVAGAAAGLEVAEIAGLEAAGAAEKAAAGPESSSETRQRSQDLPYTDFFSARWENEDAAQKGRSVLGGLLTLEFVDERAPLVLPLAVNAASMDFVLAVQERISQSILYQLQSYTANGGLVWVAARRREGELQLQSMCDVKASSSADLADILEQLTARVADAVGL